VQFYSALESPGLVLSIQQCRLNAIYDSDYQTLTKTSTDSSDTLLSNTLSQPSLSVPIEETNAILTDTADQPNLDEFQQILSELLQPATTSDTDEPKICDDKPVITTKSDSSEPLPCFLDASDLDSDFVVQQLLDWDPQLLSEADCASFDKFIESNSTADVPLYHPSLPPPHFSAGQTSNLCVDVPLPRTHSIFAPRTADMSTGYLVFSGDAVSVLEEDKAEKEDLDLTHLAPQAGDGAVPLDFDRCPPVLDAQMEELLSELGVFVTARNNNGNSALTDKQLDFDFQPNQLSCETSSASNLKRSLPNDLNDFDFDPQPTKHSRRDQPTTSTTSTNQMLCFCEPPEHVLEACPAGPPVSLALDDPFLCLSPQTQLIEPNVDLISPDFEPFNENGSDSGSHSPSVYISGKQISDDSQDCFDKSAMALPTGQPLNFLNLTEPNGLSSVACGSTQSDLTCTQQFDRHQSPFADSGVSSVGSHTDGLFCSSVWDSPPSSSSADSFSGTESLDNGRSDCLVTGNDQKLQANSSAPALLSDDSMWDSFINSNIGELLNSDEFLPILNGNGSKSGTPFLTDDLFGLDLAPSSAPILRGPSVATLPPDSNLATLLRQQLPVKPIPKLSPVVVKSLSVPVSASISERPSITPIVSNTDKPVISTTKLSITGLVQERPQPVQHSVSTMSGKVIKLTANSGKRTILPVSTRTASLQIAGKLLLSPTSNHLNGGSGHSNSQPSIQIVQANGKLQPGFSLNIIHSKPSGTINSCLPSSSANTSTTSQLITTGNSSLVTRTGPNGNATATSFIIKSVNGKLANGILYTPIVTTGSNGVRTTLTGSGSSSGALSKATIIQATLAPSNGALTHELHHTLQKRTISTIRMSAPVKRTLITSNGPTNVIDNACQAPKMFASLPSTSTTTSNVPSLACATSGTL
jgi:hypothetical protein